MSNKGPIASDKLSLGLAALTLVLSVVFLSNCSHPVPARTPSLAKTEAADHEFEKRNFPFERYETVQSGAHRFYLDEGSDAIKDILRVGQVWEPHIQREFKAFVTEGDTVVDVGAHIGTHTVFLNDLVGSQGTVYAFEPQGKLFFELLQNLKLNHSSRVLPFQIALGQEAGWVEMNPTLLGNEGGTGVGAGGDKAELRSLDSFSLPRLDLLKIDVEGYEIPVLSGAQRTIERCKPTILVEIMGGLDYETAGPDGRIRIEFARGLLASFGYHTQKLWHHDYLAQIFVKGPTGFWLDAGEEKARVFLDSGLGPDQQEPLGCSYVVTDGLVSRLMLPIESPVAREYRLALRVRSPVFASPQTVLVKLNEELLGEIRLLEHWALPEFSVPAGVVQSGRNRLELVNQPVPNEARDGSKHFFLDLVWLTPVRESLEAS